MRDLVAEPGTHLYFDASFLMLLAKMGRQAREEFVGWTRSAGINRFHVPLWAGHEFFKHRVDHTLVKELPAEIKKFDSATTDLFSSLQIQASDELFGFHSGGSLVIDEFKRTVQPLRALLKLVAKSSSTADGVLAIGSYIDELLLPGPLDALIDDIEVDERVRNRGRLPPAFQDAHKRAGRSGDKAEDGDTRKGGDNSFGDLVFWREVLRHAASAKAKAVVVITKDRKNDWYENYRPDDGKTVDIRKRAPRARQIPTPHPMLVREAHDIGMAALDLIDPVYCGILLETIDPAMKHFPPAVLDLELPEPPKSDSALRNWAARFGAGAKLLGGSIVAEATDADFDPAELDSDMLADARAPSAIAKPTLDALTAGAPLALAALLAELDPDQFADWSGSDITAFGRAVAELAIAGSHPAARYLENLRDLGPTLPAALRLPMAFGAIGAAFVTRGLTAAPMTGARTVLTLLDMVTLPEFAPAVERLGITLDALGVGHHLDVSAKVELEIVATPSANNKAPADLAAIKLDGVNLITDAQPDEALRLSRLLGQEGGQLDIELGPLVDLVARFGRLPRQKIVVNADLNTKVRVPEFTGIETED